MGVFADRPLDFAYATLLLIAVRVALNTVLTVDHADFETYRIGSRGRFRVVPER
jgi:hypothetical protein